MRSCLQIISSLTLTRTLFIRLSWTFRWPSVTEVLLLAVTVVLYRKRVVRQRLRLTYSSVLDVLKMKIVEIASGLSFFCQDIPIVGSIAYAGWKESSRKCLSHKKLCLDGPFQRSRVCSVLLTCRIHCSLRRSSLRN